MHINTNQSNSNAVAWTVETDPDIRELIAEIAALKRRSSTAESRLAAQTETTQRARSQHATAKAAYETAFAKWRADGHGENDLDVLKVKMDDVATVLSLEETKRAALDVDAREVDKQLSKEEHNIVSLLHGVRERRMELLIQTWLDNIIVAANALAKQAHSEGVASPKRERRFDFLYQAIGHGNYPFQQACSALDTDDWPEPSKPNDERDEETA